MAGEYSRELSVKVFAGQCRLVELGCRQGGAAGYRLRRVLIDEHGNPKGELSRGEQKRLQTDRDRSRSGEYRLGETASGPPGAGAGAQPLPHNPRKQRKNPAAAGSGERFRGGKWRRRWDSNPRDPFGPTPLAGERLRPLGHVSVASFNDVVAAPQGENGPDFR